MPRTQFGQRQKNKPFKGKSKTQKNQTKGKASTKTKHIGKAKSRVKNSRINLVHEAKHKRQNQVQKLANKNEYLDSVTKSIVVEKMKNETEIKIVVLLAGNKDANTDELLNEIYNEVKTSECGLEVRTEAQGLPYHALQLIPAAKSVIKNKIMIISGELKSKETGTSFREIQSLHDLIKCADIICPVLSCKQTNTQAMNLDPHEQGGAFDQNGYTMLNMIRSMGTPTVIGVVQHLKAHDMRHHDKIERLFKRFISSQLGETDKISYLKGNQRELNKLVRQMDTTPINQLPWKRQRGYILAENVTFEENPALVTFHGYLKGSCINANQLVHITGFDDFEIQQIVIKPTRKHNSMNHEELCQHSTLPESLFAFSKAEQHTEDLLSALAGLKIQQQNKQIDDMQMQEEDDGFEDQSDDDQNVDMQEYFGNKQEQKAKRVEMQMRKQDELQFEDQVEYAAEQVLREKFKEYQGLKNFKTSNWNQLENLPDEYDRIYTFKHYTRTKNSVVAQNQAKGFAYPGFYVSITVRNFPREKLQEHCAFYPIILTFLLKHERKMTQLHAKVRRNPFYPSNETVIESNQHFFISMGFRRIVVRPIFSRIIQGTEKTKYTKNIKEDYESYFYCSFYYYNYFPPAPVQIYRVNQLNFADKELTPVMYGELIKCDPLHVTLERIILTGYPFKIYKRRSTIRFMFFNPKDVKYFKPVEVRTKLGLKGRIEESIGLHGFMKVLFNDKIKHNDTVCLHLYRRVYPEPAF